MINSEVFIEAVNSKLDLVAYFIYDCETNYFYFCDFNKIDGSTNIKNYIFIGSGYLGLNEKNTRVKWCKNEEYVGLFIKGKLEAVFGIDNTKYGGEKVNSKSDDIIKIPYSLIEVFEGDKN